MRQGTKRAYNDLTYIVVLLLPVSAFPVALSLLDVWLKHMLVMAVVAHRTCAYLLLLLVQLLPLGAEELANLACREVRQGMGAYNECDIPNPASGFSALTRSLQS